MPRHQRLEDVHCAICMESLFNAKDDLDDVLPIAAPDCGHVFHEHCVKHWFQTQQKQYLDMLREQGEDADESDAPVECPTCRAETFADPETGKPIIHRLYINFPGEDSLLQSSSPIRSSSSRAWGAAASQKAKEREKEVMGLARRAKGMGQEVESLDADSTEEDIEGMLKRAEGLKDDLVSVKAIEGIKKYVAGLGTNLNALRVQIEVNPLSDTLQGRLRQLQTTNNDLSKRLQDYATTVLPNEVNKAVSTERLLQERKIKSAQKEKDLLMKELAQESVARKTAKREAEERLKDMEKKLQESRLHLKKEEQERESISQTLNERNKLLKAYQAKAESRKELKAEVATLRAENSKLKMDMQTLGSSSRPRKALPRQSSKSHSQENSMSPDGEDYPDREDHQDISIEEIESDAFTQQSRKVKRKSYQDPDESLEVDMPSFNDSLMGRNSRYSIEGPSTSIAPIRNPTARTFSSEQFADLAYPAKKKSKSKYFSSIDAPEGSMKPPTTFLEISEDSILVEESSPIRPTNTRASNTNPFITTKESSNNRNRLNGNGNGKGKNKVVEVIDLSTSSPGTPLMARHDSNVRISGAPQPQQQVEKKLALWMADANGRPKKGVVAGAPKQKRRI